MKTYLLIASICSAAFYSPAIQAQCNDTSAPAVWGFADLHCHPASHLAFGANSKGESGLFWGKPADDKNLSVLTLSRDLPPCPIPAAYGPTHKKDNYGLVQLITDKEIISETDQTVQLPPQWKHQKGGAKSFCSWPSAKSVDHQQMDITSIKRAYEGGLRLMFASVTDDEVLSDLWNQGFNLLGNPMPRHSTSFDFYSADNQLKYIVKLVNANSSWMQIVSSPDEARAVINSNKLAVILSLEMDALSIEQIRTLVDKYNVRHVIPIHLVDNSFGGTAVYNDVFNAENNFFNGNFYGTTADPRVNFQLGGQAKLIPIGAKGIFGYKTSPFSAAAPKLPGEINARGLNATLFQELMAMGLLLDIAHMGEKSADKALTLAEQYKYPLLDSHTGLRRDGSVAEDSTPYGTPSCALTGSASGVNERSLPVSQVRRIARLGGVIGMGLVSAGEGDGIADVDPVGSWITNYAIAWSLMGGKGVALGTDCNGLSPLIAYDTAKMKYPITVANDFSPNKHRPHLSPFKLGRRKFHVDSDGIATYALLPDFIQAAYHAIHTRRTTADTSAIIASLFHSAEDVIEMWEKDCAASHNIPAPVSKQVPGSCRITATGQFNMGNDAPPVLGEPVVLETTVLDLANSPMPYTGQLSYSGNVTGAPAAHLMNGFEQFKFTPGIPGTYTVTAGFLGGAGFQCSVSMQVPPILYNISSSLAPRSKSYGWKPLANSDGSTVVTVKGLGFSKATGVMVNGTIVSLNAVPNSDTSLTFIAPPITGASDQAVTVSVISASGLRSNTDSIQYFTPHVPSLAIHTSESCDHLKRTFTISAHVRDTKGNRIPKAEIGIAVGDFTASASTSLEDGRAVFTGSFSSLSPAEQPSYSGTASYKNHSTTFTLVKPVPPSPADCAGRENKFSASGNGPIFANPDTCISCTLIDLPDSLHVPKYYIDDLYKLGAILVMQNQLLPQLPVTRADFLEALAKVLNPDLAHFVKTPGESDKELQSVITRGEAAKLVEHFTEIKEAHQSAPSSARAMVRANYMHKIKGSAEYNRPLTRIEMVDLLWHVAREEFGKGVE